MVGIVDYGMGNLKSVYHALDMVGAEPQICKHPAELDHIERVILPGVGAFGDCMANLQNRGFVEALENAVMKRGIPFLGICLGMQILSLQSDEGGQHNGLGWVDATVVRLRPSDPALRVPHVGWNNIEYNQNHPIFAHLPKAPDVYFVHSYFLQYHNVSDVIATCEYGGSVTAAICKDNIFATQFHPEKSQDYGLQILENFLSWTP
jgi:glutamine amidotransferase